MAENVTNKDHRIIIELSEKIDRAGDLKEEIEDSGVKREKYKNVKFDSKHKYFPYGAMLQELGEEARTPTFKKGLILFLYLFLIYASLFASPAGAVFVLDYLDVFAYSRFLDEAVFALAIIGAYIVVFAVFLLSFKKCKRKLRAGLDKRKRKRLLKRRKERLSKALDDSRRMIREYEAGFAEKIEAADKRIEEAQKELSALEEDFAKNATVPLKFIPEIQRVKSYFDERRAETIKEALNLLVAEKREEEHFEDLMEMLKRHLSTLENLEEEFSTVEEYQKTLAEHTLKEDREKQRKAQKGEREKEIDRERRQKKKTRKGKKEAQKRIKKMYY